jgi:hypothetical protein
MQSGLLVKTINLQNGGQKKRRPSPHLISQFGEGRRYPIRSMCCKSRL